MQLTNKPQEPHRGPALRRGKQIPPINTAFEPKPVPRLQRLQRPRPIETVIYEQSPTQDNVNHNAHNVPKKISKGGLRSLFTRSKSANDVKSDFRLASAIEEEDIPEVPVARFLTPSVKSTSTGQTSVSRQDSPLHVVGPASSLQLLSMMTTKKSLIEREDPARSLKTWNPPPLFQAYPQSVKHSHLSAPTASTETILKLDKSRRVGGRTSHHLENNATSKLDLAVDGKRRIKELTPKKPKSRKIEVPQLEWTFKIFVLATSGFLLQYAGDGKYDRLPEKILQLGKTSAAFASDVIPGKRWVLQILQAATEDGVMARSKSVFSKFGFHNDLKHSVPSFLLVLDNPEEMDSWLVAVRKEIEALGGKKYRPNVRVRKTTDEIVQQLRERPSRRYLIKRDPNLYSNPPDLHSSSVDGTHQENKDADVAEESELRISEPTKRLTLSSGGGSIHAPSTVHTSISTDQIMLDRLRESKRSSYASTNARTYATSCDASPVPSPVTTNFIPKVNDRDVNKATPPAIEKANRRRSFQTLATVVDDQQRDLDFQSLPKLSRPISVNNPSTLRSTSPPTPNFSAPSFSKRYSQSGYPLPVPFIPKSSGPTSYNPSSPDHGSTALERPESVIGELPASIRANLKAARLQASGNSETLTLSASSTSQSDQTPYYLTSNSFHADRPVPRRFSSLEYSTINVSPKSHSPAPHPPPTSALPALPPPDISVRPSSTPSTVFHRLRRPASMQVRGEAQSSQIRSSSSQAKMYSSDAASLLHPKKKALRSPLLETPKYSPSVPLVRVEASTPEVGSGWAQAGGKDTVVW